MSIAFVNGVRGGAVASASSIVAAAFAATAGNLIVAAYYIDDFTINPSGVPTDTAGNTYKQAGTTQVIGGGGGNLCMFYAYNCLGNASNVITLNLSGSSGSRAYDVWQFSGLPVSDPKIGTAFGSGNSGTSLTVSSSLSHGASECVIPALGVSYAAAITGGGTSYTFTAFTITSDSINHWGDEYLITSSDNTPSESTTSASVAWGIIAASYGSIAVSKKLPLLGAGR